MPKKIRTESVEIMSQEDLIILINEQIALWAIEEFTMNERDQSLVSRLDENQQEFLKELTESF